MSIDLSLARIKQLYSHLPPYTRPTIHIAGTNGKGSVSSYLSFILRASGLKVGRYNSPHLVSVTDCIVINGSPISQTLYETTRAKVQRACTEHNVELSSFEILTTTALSVFEDEQVDIAVIEVGMGGLRDATNIIPDDCILVSALTSVDLDHQAFLGSTVEEIAKEKSSIVRPGRAFVIGKQRYQGVEHIRGGILVHAVKVSKRNWDESIDGPAPPAFSLPSSASPVFSPPSLQPISAPLPCFTEQLHALLPLHGEHQLDNVGTALGIVSALLTHPPSPPSTSQIDFKARITIESVKQGIKDTKWPGRLSFHTLTLAGSSKPTVVLADGAHNPASAATLSSAHPVAVAEFTPPEGMPWVRLCGGSDGRERSTRGEEVEDAQELVVIAGSLYLVADFYRFSRRIETIYMLLCARGSSSNDDDGSKTQGSFVCTDCFI
ncbi:Mur ligase [Cyathus striatus]|nr:Mur ligase [Cyathus striatus]